MTLLLPNNRFVGPNLMLFQNSEKKCTTFVLSLINERKISHFNYISMPTHYQPELTLQVSEIKQRVCISLSLRYKNAYVGSAAVCCLGNIAVEPY